MPMYTELEKLELEIKFLERLKNGLEGDKDKINTIFMGRGLVSVKRTDQDLDFFDETFLDTTGNIDGPKRESQESKEIEIDGRMGNSLEKHGIDRFRNLTDRGKCVFEALEFMTVNDIAEEQQSELMVELKSYLQEEKLTPDQEKQRIAVGKKMEVYSSTGNQRYRAENLPCDALDGVDLDLFCCFNQPGQFVADESLKEGLDVAMRKKKVIVHHRTREAEAEAKQETEKVEYNAFFHIASSLFQGKERKGPTQMINSFVSHLREHGCQNMTTDQEIKETLKQACRLWETTEGDSPDKLRVVKEILGQDFTLPPYKDSQEIANKRLSGGSRVRNWKKNLMRDETTTELYQFFSTGSSWAEAKSSTDDVSLNTTTSLSSRVVLQQQSIFKPPLSSLSEGPTDGNGNSPPEPKA